MGVKLVHVEGTKHHVPKDVLPFFRGLEEIVGRGKLRNSGFTRKGATVREIDDKHYDENNKILTIRIKDPSYIQTFLVVSDDIEELRKVHEYIKNYEF